MKREIKKRSANNNFKQILVILALFVFVFSFAMILYADETKDLEAKQKLEEALKIRAELGNTDFFYTYYNSLSPEERISFFESLKKDPLRNELVSMLANSKSRLTKGGKNVKFQQFELEGVEMNKDGKIVIKSTGKVLDLNNLPLNANEITFTFRDEDKVEGFMYALQNPNDPNGDPIFVGDYGKGTMNSEGQYVDEKGNVLGDFAKSKGGALFDIIATKEGLVRIIPDSKDCYFNIQGEMVLHKPNSKESIAKGDSAFEFKDGELYSVKNMELTGYSIENGKEVEQDMIVVSGVARYSEREFKAEGESFIYKNKDDKGTSYRVYAKEGDSVQVQSLTDSKVNLEVVNPKGEKTGNVYFYDKDGNEVQFKVIDDKAQAFVARQEKNIPKGKTIDRKEGSVELSPGKDGLCSGDSRACTGSRTESYPIIGDVQTTSVYLDSKELENLASGLTERELLDKIPELSRSLQVDIKLEKVTPLILTSGKASLADLGQPLSTDMLVNGIKENMQKQVASLESLPEELRPIVRDNAPLFYKMAEDIGEKVSQAGITRLPQGTSAIINAPSGKNPEFIIRNPAQKEIFRTVIENKEYARVMDDFYRVAVRVKDKDDGKPVSKEFREAYQQYLRAQAKK